MIKFRAKEFSSHIISDTITGAKIGAAGGAAISSIVPRFRKKGGKIVYDDTQKGNNSFNSLKVVGLGLIVGASLGFLAGAAKDINEWNNRKTTIDNRLMKDILSLLKKSGSRENIDFTRDPKIANDLKTKVCIVISKHSDDLKILINTINDPKLKTLTDKITKSVPNGSIKNNTTSDRYNEITISTLSSSADADLIVEIMKMFISAKYSVYVVEVG